MTNRAFGVAQTLCKASGRFVHNPTAFGVAERGRFAVGETVSATRASVSCVAAFRAGGRFHRCNVVVLQRRCFAVGKAVSATCAFVRCVAAFRAGGRFHRCNVVVLQRSGFTVGKAVSATCAFVSRVAAFRAGRRNNGNLIGVRKFCNFARFGFSANGAFSLLSARCRASCRLGGCPSAPTVSSYRNNLLRNDNGAANFAVAAFR